MTVASTRHAQQGRRREEGAELEDRALLGREKESRRRVDCAVCVVCKALGTLRRVHDLNVP